MLINRNEAYMNSNTLRKLQLTELEILKIVDKICLENGINYFLVGGTLLGAQRIYSLG